VVSLCDSARSEEKINKSQKDPGFVPQTARATLKKPFVVFLPMMINDLNKLLHEFRTKFFEQ
jgi:hypothetical protein